MANRSRTSTPGAASIRLLPQGASKTRDVQNHDDDDFAGDTDSDFGDENEPLQGGGGQHSAEEERTPPRSRSSSRRNNCKNCCDSLGVLFGLGIVLTVIFVAFASGIAYWSKYVRHSDGSPKEDSSPRVDLGYATYVGTALSVQPPSDDGGNLHNVSAPAVSVHRYLGMRYAAPPTGEQRWRAPGPPDNQTGLQSAKEFRSICIGLAVLPLPDSGPEEDCLFVNVWGPASFDANATGVPVWVFIQGGGYNANSNADIDGADVVARAGGNVVFVNFNYRVGLYGFLGIPQDDTSEASNFGLLDQRALLAWVQQHIHRFGGDPRHVVVHGGSAGAGSVALHTVTHDGRDDGLFAGVVSESLFVPTLPKCADVAYKFWKAVESVCPKGGKDALSVTSALACLRRQPTVILQRHANTNAPLQYHGEDRPGNAGFYWGPCVDGTLLTDRPSVLFANGKFVRVPMLYGINTDEGTVLVPNAASEGEVVEFLLNNYPGLADDNKGANVVHTHYPQEPSVPWHNDWYPTLAKMFGELTFVCPSVATLDAVASAAADVPLYAYRYAMQDPENMANGIGTVHMMDAAAIFGPSNVACCPPASYTTEPDADHSGDHDGNPGLVPIMMDYYLSFVRTFNPNTYKSAHATEWGQWSGKSRLVITSGSNQTMETVPDDQAERCRVWLDLAGVTEQ
ncbi:hypothetical protein SEUCBS139899_005754 [Sporothrix eucalyptigena]|uniref:Carboxylic ester hydrolase n=1 Tax=Sporothrix eucalyptigena TaxID=1812306 RepID=A0ABP0BND0_9PEZI